MNNIYPTSSYDITLKGTDVDTLCNALRRAIDHSGCSLECRAYEELGRRLSELDATPDTKPIPFSREEVVEILSWLKKITVEKAKDSRIHAIWGINVPANNLTEWLILNIDKPTVTKAEHDGIMQEVRADG